VITQKQMKRNDGMHSLPSLVDLTTSASVCA
jgi:hypothetical protein